MEEHRQMERLVETVGNLEKTVNEMRSDIKPIIEIYNGSKFLRTVFMGVGTFLVTLIGIGMSIYSLVNWLRH